MTQEQTEKQREYRRRLEIEQEAGRLASYLVEEYAAALREKVQDQAEALRQELSRNAHSRLHSRALTLEAIDRLEHSVIKLAPPSMQWARTRLEDERS